MAQGESCFVARYGPSPMALGQDGAIDASFTHSMIFSTALPLRQMVAQLWGQITAEGHGHLLLGAYERLRCGIQAGGATTSCGTEELVGASIVIGDPQIDMVGYVPLFAIARAPPPLGAEPGSSSHVDLSIDYRGTTGPGDPSIVPAVYVAAAQHR